MSRIAGPRAITVAGSADSVQILWNLDGFGLFKGSVHHKENIEQQPSYWKIRGLLYLTSMTVWDQFRCLHTSFVTMNSELLMPTSQDESHSSLSFVASCQGHHRRETTAVRGDRHRVHERWPSFSGRVVCKSPSEGQMWQVSDSLSHGLCKVDTNWSFYSAVISCFVVVSSFFALEVAGGCRPAGGTLCVSRAHGQRVGPG